MILLKFAGSSNTCSGPCGNWHSRAKFLSAYLLIFSSLWSMCGKIYFIESRSNRTWRFDVSLFILSCPANFAIARSVCWRNVPEKKRKQGIWGWYIVVNLVSWWANYWEHCRLEEWKLSFPWRLASLKYVSHSFLPQNCKNWNRFPSEAFSFHYDLRFF